ncbi:MAG: formate dehydrogenase accessory sulfurtransferase FdhD [Nakamurella sp.]
MGRITMRHRVAEFAADGAVFPAERVQAVEEPLEIQVNGRVFGTVMRTPGDDVELAIGLLLSAGAITSGDQVFSGEFCPGTNDVGANTYNVLAMTLAPGLKPQAPGGIEAAAAASSLGVCGQSLIDAVCAASAHHVTVAAQDRTLGMTAQLAAEAGRLLGEQRPLFAKTGSTAAAALLDAATGALLVVREDVHQARAVDKVVGWAAADGCIPLAGVVLVISGAADFDGVQTACMAGVSVVVSVGPPTSLAAQLADRAGMTLIAAMPDSSLVSFAGADRLTR